MKLPGRKTVTRHVRRLRGRFGPRAVILGYHRISTEPWDPFSLGVSRSNFAAHLEALRAWANPIRLTDLVRELEAGHVPHRAVVVTFDDGYADALHTARPLLERVGVPATVFVITGKIGEEPWWDELARLVGSAPASALARLPAAVDASPTTRPPPTLSYDLSEAGFRRESTGSGGGESRVAQLHALHGLLGRLGEEDRAAAMSRVREALSDGSLQGKPAEVAPTPEAPAAGAHRCLDADELRKLARSELIEVGAHSHTHPGLAPLTPAEQRREIETSKASLEELVSRRITSFSYPHGSFVPETRRIVKDCGFESACSSTPDLARARSDRFALPRLFVSDVDGESFAKWLTWWLGR